MPMKPNKSEVNQIVAACIENLPSNEKSVLAPIDKSGQLMLFSPAEFFEWFMPPPPPDNEYIATCPALGTGIQYRIYAPSPEWAIKQAALTFGVGESFVKIREARNAETGKK